MPTQHDILLQNELPTPLGRLRLSGRIHGGYGVERGPLRVYGAYAVMYVVRGTGSYVDSNRRRIPMAAGDVALVFPERGHWYGPTRGQTWDELYLAFDGPIFDLLRAAHVLEPTQPVRTAPEGWADSFATFVERAGTGSTPAARLRQITEFADLLTALLASDQTTTETDAASDDSILGARALLEINLAQTLDLSEVAAMVGLSYETFRKRFQKEVGVSPAHYRTLRRIEAAQELLRYSPQMKNRQVAQTLGFADEYHFSKRFTQITGSTPREFRLQERSNLP